MANKYRGEVDLILGGKAYPVALTLSAIARIAAEIKVETLDEFEGRVRELRIKDMGPITRALLEAAGHDVPRSDIEAVGVGQYTRTIIALWNARPLREGQPDEAAGEADPQARAV